MDTSTITSVRRGRRTTAAAQSGSENNQRNVFKSENFLGTVHAFHSQPAGTLAFKKTKVCSHHAHTHRYGAPKDLPRSLGIFYVAWFGADRAGVEFSKRRAAASRIVRWSGVAEQHAIVDASCDGFGSRAGGDPECLSRSWRWGTSRQHGRQEFHNADHKLLRA